MTTYCEMRHENNFCVVYPLTSWNGLQHLTPTERAVLESIERQQRELEATVRLRRGLMLLGREEP